MTANLCDSGLVAIIHPEKGVVCRMAQIMIVDDDAHVVDVVERALRRNGHLCSIARDGREAIELLRSQTPDVLVLDVVMPQVNGIQLCQYVRTNPTLKRIPILFLTMRERIEDKILGYEAGCDDYLTKPFDLAELILRVQALLRHTNQSIPTGPLLVGTLQVDPDKIEATLDGRTLELTPVEFELLYYLVSHAGEVLGTEHLLQHVWGYPPGTGNSSLVRMHILNLRRKLEDDPARPNLLKTIPRHGYTLTDSDHTGEE
jgi:DNA-binding response OmpR family regulator